MNGGTAWLTGAYDLPSNGGKPAVMSNRRTALGAIPGSIETTTRSASKTAKMMESVANQVIAQR